MMTYVMVKTYLNQEMIKKFEFDSGKKLRITHVGDRNLPKAEFIRKPNFTECRMFRSSEVWIEHTTW